MQQKEGLARTIVTWFGRHKDKLGHFQRWIEKDDPVLRAWTEKATALHKFWSRLADGQLPENVKARIEAFKRSHQDEIDFIEKGLDYYSHVTGNPNEHLKDVFLLKNPEAILQTILREVPAIGALRKTLLPTAAGSPSHALAYISSVRPRA